MVGNVVGIVWLMVVDDVFWLIIAVGDDDGDDGKSGLLWVWALSH